MMWIARNPMGGIWLTKSPNGTASAPFLAAASGRLSDAVGDDAGEPEDHADEDDEVGGVLANREPARRRGCERMLRKVEHEAERDRRDTGLRQRGNGAGAGLAIVHGTSVVLYR